MKLYVIYFDYEGYEANAEAIFETFEEAKRYLKKECDDYIENFIVEWDTKTQKTKKLRQGRNPWPNVH
jgi:hypothetical protein